MCGWAVFFMLVHFASPNIDYIAAGNVQPLFENYPVPQQRTQVRAVCDIAGNIFNLCSASLQTFQANRALHGKRLTSYAIALSVNSTRIYEPLDSKLALVHCTPKALLNVAKALRLH